jgi:hypothetical protein
MSIVRSACAAMMVLVLSGCTGVWPEAAYDDKAKMVWLGVKIEI